MLWELSQFGHVNTKTFVHHTRFDLIQQSECVILRQHHHVTVFHRRHCIGQIGDFVEMCGEHGEAFRFLCQMPISTEKRKETFVHALSRIESH